jgi:hypothetical protein
MGRSVSPWSEALTALREGGVSVFVGATAAAGPHCRRNVYPYTHRSQQGP